MGEIQLHIAATNCNYSNPHDDVSGNQGLRGTKEDWCFHVMTTGRPSARELLKNQHAATMHL